MFKGSFTYSIDPKNRISIPARLRKSVKPEADDTFVLTRGVNKCIDIYPHDQWLILEEKLNKLNPFNQRDAKFLRMFLSTVDEQRLDTQSRLLIPQNLIEYAGIEKEVFILGSVKKIEVWNPVIYQSYLAAQPELTYEQMAEDVMKDL